MNQSQRLILAAELQALLPVLVATQKQVRHPDGGWLRTMRHAMGLAQADVAQTVQVTKQAYSQFEKGEVKGSLSLGNLQRSADALNCDLVYFLVPRTDSFSELSTPPASPFPSSPATQDPSTPADPASDDLPSHLL